MSVYEANHKEVIALIAECRKIVRFENTKLNNMYKLCKITIFSRLKIFPNDSPLDGLNELKESNTKKKEPTFWTEDASVGRETKDTTVKTYKLKPVNKK